MKSIAWLVGKILIGLALAFIVGLGINLAMFFFGPWADPPGLIESWVILGVIAVILPTWHFVKRQRTAIAQ